ncbi:MAG: MBL fold metallo-hydrolase [Paracoccaceae bacterium]|nr:MBL fold metallo-hydrolase [Paracoccaceae bacterium]
MAREAEKPQVGVAEEVSPGIRRVLAPNPGAMTHWGTNSYLLGSREIAIVDPGPDDPAHRAALLKATGGATVRAILVTHAHRDHSAGAGALAEAVSAPVLAFGTPLDGRSAAMERFTATGGIGGGEGVDRGFWPDRPLFDGEVVDFGDGRVAALHTPGHFGGHLCFALGDVLFSGDHVMGWSSTLISPPDGDVRDFLASCARLAARSDRLYLPGHGAPVPEPGERLAWLVAHRHAREREVRAALENGPAGAEAITAAIYDDLPKELFPAAKRNVLAHLLDLHDRGVIRADPAPIVGALWSLADPCEKP